MIVLRRRIGEAILIGAIQVTVLRAQPYKALLQIEGREMWLRAGKTVNLRENIVIRLVMARTSQVKLGVAAAPGIAVLRLVVASAVAPEAAAA